MRIISLWGHITTALLPAKYNTYQTKHAWNPFCTVATTVWNHPVHFDAKVWEWKNFYFTYSPPSLFLSFSASESQPRSTFNMAALQCIFLVSRSLFLLNLNWMCTLTGQPFLVQREETSMSQSSAVGAMLLTTFQMHVNIRVGSSKTCYSELKQEDSTRKSINCLESKHCGIILLVFDLVLIIWK